MRIALSLFLILIASLVAKDQSRHLPNGFIPIPLTPDQLKAREEFYIGLVKRWTLTDEERDELYSLSIRGDHDPQSLSALGKVLQAHPSPRNAQLILDVLFIWDIRFKDGGKEFKALLAESFYDQEAWQRALIAVGTSRKMQAILDEVTVHHKTRYSCWWLSERIRQGHLSDDLMTSAMERIGVDGTEGELKITIDGLGGFKYAANQAMYHRTLMKFDRDQKNAGRVRPAGSTQTAIYIPHDPTVPALTDELKARITVDLDAADEKVVLKALDLAQTLQYPFVAQLMEMPTSKNRSEAVRLKALAVVEAHPKTDKHKLMELWRTIFYDAKAPQSLKDRALAGLATSTKLLDLIALQDALPNHPAETQKKIALALAGSKDGAALLLASAQNGKVPAAIVTEAAVVEKLRAAGVRDLDERLKNLPK